MYSFTQAVMGLTQMAETTVYCCILIFIVRNSDNLLYIVLSNITFIWNGNLDGSFHNTPRTNA